MRRTKITAALLAAALVAASCPVPSQAAEIHTKKAGNMTIVTVKGCDCSQLDLEEIVKKLGITGKYCMIPEEQPEAPETPEVPEQPETPEQPEVPEQPETPEQPEVPEQPERPEQPETPEQPEVPEQSETPEQPEQPEVPEQQETPEKGTEAYYVQRIVELVNEERAKAGLSEVALDPAITQAANIRAREIKQSFSHTRPNGKKFSSVLQEQGISFRGSGENIAWGQQSPEEVMTAWMNSSGHRANILKPAYKKIGVGHYQDANGRHYWAQLFTY